jgi:hypothetical protein
MARMNLRKYIVGKYVGYSLAFLVAMPIVWSSTKDWLSVALCIPPAALFAWHARQFSRTPPS